MRRSSPAPTFGRPRKSDEISLCRARSLDLTLYRPLGGADKTPSAGGSCHGLRGLHVDDRRRRPGNSAAAAISEEGFERMSELRRAVTGAVTKFAGEGVGQRQVKANVLTFGVPDRVGDVFADPKGARVANFMKYGTVLSNHDHDAPVARALSLSVQGNAMPAITQFPDPGVSAKSDEVYGLIKAGIIGAVSVGFFPIKMEPIAGGRGGLRFIEFEILEFSFVSVPCVPSALITERGLTRAQQATREERIRSARILRTIIELTSIGDGEVFSEAEACAIARRRHSG
jgi:hypothetical protein